MVLINNLLAALVSQYSYLMIRLFRMPRRIFLICAEDLAAAQSRFALLE